jgi:hypothetical protein
MGSDDVDADVVVVVVLVLVRHATREIIVEEGARWRCGASQRDA